MCVKKSRLDAAVEGIQKTRQEMQSNQLGLIKSLAEMGIKPEVVLTSYGAAQGYAKDIASGKSLPLYNGLNGGEEHGVGLFNVKNLQQPLTKDVTYKTYTADPKTGAPVEKTNTMKAGSDSVLKYVSAAAAGQADLERVMALQKNNAAIERDKATTNRENAETTKIKSDAAKEKAGQLTPEQMNTLVDAIGSGHITSIRGWDYIMGRHPEIIDAVADKYPKVNSARLGSYPKMYQEFTSGRTANSINAYGTALATLRTLYDDATWGSQAPAGKDKVKFDVDLMNGSMEIAKAINGGTAPTKEEIQGAREKLGVHLYRKDAIKQQVIDMQKKLDAFEQQWAEGSPSEAILKEQPMPGISPKVVADANYVLNDGKVVPPSGGATATAPAAQQKDLDLIKNLGGVPR